MPRLYREVPLNSIWEGPGNVMALDVLRAITKDALAGQVLIKEIKSAYGTDNRLDRLCDNLESLLENYQYIHLKLTSPCFVFHTTKKQKFLHAELYLANLDMMQIELQLKYSFFNFSF